MTTAPAGQSKTTPSSSSSRHRRRQEPSDSADSFAVLIRLPALPATDSAPAETNAPVPPSAAAVAAPPASDPQAKPAVPGTPPGLDRAPVAPTTFGSPFPTVSWNPVSGVRLLGQLALAALLIGLFVAAYLMIVGGGTTPVDKHDESGAASAAPTGRDTPPFDAPASRPEKDPALDLSQDAASSSPPTDVVPPARPALTLDDSPSPNPAPASSGPPEVDPEPSGSDAARSSRAEPLVNRSRAVEAETPSGEQAAAYPAGAEPPAEPFESGRRSMAAYPQTRDEPTARTGTYPMSDPRTFRYPADYHEILRARAGVQPPPDGSSGPVERSANAWGPRNARLQPRIEAPPLR